MFNNFWVVRKYFTFEHVYGVTNKVWTIMIAPVAVAGILMFAVLAAISSTNQAFAAEKKTELTITVYKKGPAKTEEINGFSQKWVPVTISGRLTSDGSGVAGAYVVVNCLPSEEGECGSANTDSGGHYSATVSLNATDPKSTHTIQANTHHENETSEASTTIQLP
jgi:hypothetical protein